MLREQSQAMTDNESLFCCFGFFWFFLAMTSTFIYCLIQAKRCSILKMLKRGHIHVRMMTRNLSTATVPGIYLISVLKARLGLPRAGMDGRQSTLS